MPASNSAPSGVVFRKPFYTVETPLRVTELMYHPAPPTAAELAAGYFDDDDFEFIEVTNISPSATIDLRACSSSTACNSHSAT